MARRLKLKSVGEGVETQAEWDALKTIGCDMAQGYFIAKPMEQSLFQEFCHAEPTPRAEVKPRELAS
jgi:EAL domain-containing protein (putative c-di-GMP-specific phosphodiesterase class I)